MKFKLIEPIDGFEDVAEWRAPRSGDWYIESDGSLKQAQWKWVASCPVPIRKQSTAEKVERVYFEFHLDADAVSRLLVRGLISESTAKKARTSIFRYIKATVKEVAK